MNQLRSQPPPKASLLATSLVSAVLTGILLVLRVLLAGDGATAGLSGIAEPAFAVVFLFGTVWFVALAYGLVVGVVLDAADRTLDLSRLWERARTRLGADPGRDAASAAAIVTVTIAALLYLVAFTALYERQDEDFLTKVSVASRYLAVLSVFLLGATAAAGFPIFRGVLRALALLRIDRLRSARWPLTVRVLAVYCAGLVVGGALAVFIVLRRDEMAVVRRLPLFLLSLGVLHAMLLVLLVRLRATRPVRALLRRGAVVVSTGVAGAAVVVTVLLLGSFPAAHEAAETRSEIQSILLGPLRTILDLDGDGYAALLAGGDCDDFDAARSPDAREVPGNGIDEDCQGGDADPNAVAAWEADPGLMDDGAVAVPDVPPVAAPRPEEHAAAAIEGATPKEPTGEAPEEPKPPPPLPRPGLNVLFVLVDTVRADHVGFYGYERDTTPAMDEIARHSVVFRHAYAQANNTPRSMPSIFSSRFPSEIHWLRKDRNYPKLKDAEYLMGEAFSDAGYRVEAETSHHYFQAKRNIQQGFDDWGNPGFGTIAESNTAVASPQIVPRAIKRLNRLARADKPFFLFVHLYEPHGSYMSHPAPANFGRELMDKYDGEVRFVDDYLGQLVSALDATGRADDTIVLVTSDHGEAFREHGYYFHGHTVYNEEIAVPLIMRIPGVSPRVRDARVALVDILPTLLASVGVDLPTGIQGVSLVPVMLEGKKRGLPIYSELIPYPSWPEDQRALILGHHKVLYTKKGGVFELYDIAADPLEQSNLFRQHPRAQVYKQAILDWMRTKVGGR